MSLTSATSFAAFDAAPFAYESAAFLQPIPRPAHSEAVVRITPRYGRGPCTVTLRYFWHGAADAPTVIVQGGISASRDVCSHGVTRLRHGCAGALQAFYVFLSVDRHRPEA